MHARHCCQLSLRQIALGPALSVRLMDSQIKGVKKARGVPLEILGGGIPPYSLNPDPISDQKCHFPYPFADLAFRQKLCHHYLDKRADKKIKFFKSISYSHISLSFLLIYPPPPPPPQVPSKTIPDSRPKWAKFIPVFGPKKAQKPYPTTSTPISFICMTRRKYYNIAKAT